MPALFDHVLIISFRTHDLISEWLARHFFSVKKGLLLLAHACLLGFFFPELRKDFGEAAGNLLIFILFLSPISKIFRIRLFQQLMGLRRELGITFGYLATVHGLGYLTDPFIGALFKEHLLSQPLLIGWPLLCGFLAYLLTLPLLLTSNTLANRILGGRNWKLLHRSVYLMALLAVAHRFAMNGMTGMALLEMIVLVSGYILAKLVAWRNFLPPLVQAIGFVASRYQAYRTTLNPVSITPPTPPVAPTPVA